MFRVPCYAELGPSRDDRVMHAHVLEGRVGSSGSVDLVLAPELAKGAALVIADEMRESVCKMGVVPAFAFEEGSLKDKPMNVKMES